MKNRRWLVLVTMLLSLLWVCSVQGAAVTTDEVTTEDTEVTVTPTITPTATPTVTATPTPTVKNGLKKENGHFRYYKNGKLLKSTWKTCNGSRYYFKSNGNAATYSYKIKGTYYVFNKKGQLLKGSKKRIVTVGKYKYYVNKYGKAIKGIYVINTKFYSFNTNGKYNKTKTQKLRSAAKYSKSFSSLKKLIGKPKKTKYYGSSCFGPGIDAILTYSTFKVYVYEYKNKVLYMGAE